MARETEPLLARRPSSHESQAAADEDALLTNHTQGGDTAPRFSGSRWHRLRETLVFVWAFLATIAIIVLAVLLQRSRHDRPPSPSPGKPSGVDGPHGKRNLIFMVSDGMGPSSLSLTRSFSQLVNKAEFNHTLLLDSLLVGQSRTRSSNSLVTDSAAGATAFSCGEKSYNGAISILPDGRPCPSVMEGAKKAGYRTGVVVTTRVTDATPACFGAHVRFREMEDSIAGQMTGLSGLGNYTDSPMDLILGGGRCHFLPNTEEGSCRLDAEDVISSAKSNNWTYVSKQSEFAALNPSPSLLPLLGLFAHTDIPFELDRRIHGDLYPSLADSATFALDLLSAATEDSDRGFFLMIEGSRIDHAGHHNDPAAQVHEVMAYDATVRAVLDFIDRTDVPTLMLATSDHETGGLAIARQLDNYTYPHYHWFPDVLARASHTAEWVSHEYHAHLAASDDAAPADLAKTLRTLVETNLGFSPTGSEVKALIARPVFAVWILADMISRRARIGWSTHGHTGADVNIYSSAARSGRARARGKAGVEGATAGERVGGAAWEERVLERMAGNRENTDVGKVLRWWLGVEREVEDVGKELRGQGGGEEGERAAGTVEFRAQGPGTEESVIAGHGQTGGDALLGEYEEWRKGWTWDDETSDWDQSL